MECLSRSWSVLWARDLRSWRVSGATGVQVEEGRQLPIESKRVAVDLARANQRVTALNGDLDYSEASLAVVLLAQPGTAGEKRYAPGISDSEESLDAAARAASDCRRSRA